MEASFRCSWSAASVIAVVIRRRFTPWWTISAADRTSVCSERKKSENLCRKMSALGWQS